MIKKLIKNFTPSPIKRQIINVINYRQSKLNLRQLKINFKQDMKKYYVYASGFGGEKTQRHHEADLIFYYHKIEKGLSLPNPRVGFGKKSVEYLISILESYIKKYGWDDVSLISLNTLYEYYYFNERHNLKLNNLYNGIEKLKSTLQDEEPSVGGGIDEITKEEIVEKINFNYKDFVYSRYSIRNFSTADVSLELIKESVHIAQKTPSVCNRQSSRVYVYSDEKLKEEILKHQNGNAGFGNHASKILIVTSELKDFRGVIERNQSYIDGGMYSMSLIYALHSLGVGTCPLNLSITNETEIKLKKAAKIGDSEVLLMMIAVGNLPQKLKVASSPRRDAEEIMTVY